MGFSAVSYIGKPDFQNEADVTVVADHCYIGHRSGRRAAEVV